MSYVLAEPQALASVAADIDELGSTITAANGDAAVPISGLAAAAADEVSEAIAKLFGAYGQQYQAVAARAAAFHSGFTQALAAAGSAYATAEADAQALLAGSTATQDRKLTDVANDVAPDRKYRRRGHGWQRQPDYRI